jgi:hypothetical protein
MIDYAKEVRVKKDPKAEVLEAQRAARELVAFREGTLEKLITGLGVDVPWIGEPSMLAMLGKRNYEHSLQKDPDLTDIDVARVLMHEASERGDDIEAASLLLPPFQLRACWSARWYQQAKPRIVWEPPAYAEQLMVSPPHRDVLEYVRSPWDAFLLDLPRDLLYSDSPKNGERCELTHVLVHNHENTEGARVWHFMAHGPGGVELWRHGVSTDQLVHPEKDTFSELYAGSIANEDELTLQYIGNLIVGTCLTLSDPTKFRVAKNTKARRRGIRGEKSKKTKTVPATRNFVVGVPVKVRIRGAIEESYELVRNHKRRGKIKALRLASFVAGHWKNQAYGPKHSLRRPQHVEGYWRNLDKDNPIVVRDHLVMKKEETWETSKKPSGS